MKRARRFALLVLAATLSSCAGGDEAGGGRAPDAAGAEFAADFCVGFEMLADSIGGKVQGIEVNAASRPPGQAKEIVHDLVGDLVVNANEVLDTVERAEVEGVAGAEQFIEAARGAVEEARDRFRAVRRRVEDLPDAAAGFARRSAEIADRLDETGDELVAAVAGDIPRDVQAVLASQEACASLIAA